MLGVGKRYTCASCGTQVLVTKPGQEDAEVTCCGAPVAAEEPKQVASSD